MGERIFPLPDIEAAVVGVYESRDRLGVFVRIQNGVPRADIAVHHYRNLGFCTVGIIDGIPGDFALGVSGGRVQKV